MGVFAFSQVHTIIAQCADMSKSTEFYRDVLGLTPTMVNPYWTTFQVGSDVVALHPLFGPDPLTRGGWTLCLAVDDVRALRESLVADSIPLTQDFHDIPGGVLIGFEDPDGNYLQALQQGVQLSDFA